ncbi:MAG: cytochrome [Ilumatobacteraceae bacterium]|nr:cytochrome [Ilumatobacteraceae bacterium]
MTSVTSDHEAIDLLDGELYTTDPYPKYAWMRDNAPAYWDSINELWGISRYDDIVEIERRKDVFINSDQAKGGYRPNLPADAAIIGLDDPFHAQRRSLVARRFTPRAVSDKGEQILTVVTSLLDAALAPRDSEHPVEIIEELASPLPALMIGRLLGFEDSDWPKLRDWSERTIVMGGGPRCFTQDGMDAAIEFAVAANDLYESKKGCPMDDLMTMYTTAEITGQEFGAGEAVSDALLLLDGGAETTRTVIARTLLLLDQHPEEWAKLKTGADIGVAVEEFIRYVTPIHNMCRVANVDYDLNGTTIPAGHQVVLMYSSANRDPAHFEDPETFDVTRTPNHHIAFGFGTHFCLGAALARLEIRTFFEEFVRRVESFRIVPGSVVEMPNPFVYGVKSAHIELVAAGS